jgi:Mechanosensitive ion channel, conserved TM helix
MNLLDTLGESFNRAIADLVNALPVIIGALLILLVGMIVGRIVGGIVARLLAGAKADTMFARYAGTIYGEAPGSSRPSEYVGALAKWLIYVIFFLAAANFLGWTQVSVLINQFLAWLPNLIVAVIIVIAAPVIGRLLRTAIDASGESLGLSNTNLLGRMAELAVIGFAIIIALYQVGIASDLVNIMFIGLTFGLALAFGLAFGLGGRSVAEEVSRNWYARSVEMASKIVDANSDDTPAAVARPAASGGMAAPAQPRSPEPPSQG